MLPQAFDLPQVPKATKLFGPFKQSTRDVGVDRGPSAPLVARSTAAGKSPLWGKR